MKNIFDKVNDVKAVALMKNGQEVGKIVAKWSKSGVCSCSVLIYSENINAAYMGRAGGYGYDKFSQAIWLCLKHFGLDKKIKVEPASGNQRTAFENAGYTWVEVI